MSRVRSPSPAPLHFPANKLFRLPPGARCQPVRIADRKRAPTVPIPDDVLGIACSLPGMKRALLVSIAVLVIVLALFVLWFESEGPETFAVPHGEIPPR